LPRQVTRVTGPRDRVETLSPGLPEIKEKSGPSRVNAPEGPVIPAIPRSRRNLFSFGENDNAGTKAGKSHAGGAFSFPSLANHDIFKDYIYMFITVGPMKKL